MKAAMVACALACSGAAQAATTPVNLSGTMTDLSMGTTIFGVAGPVSVGLDQHVQLTYSFSHVVDAASILFLWPEARHDIYKDGVGRISTFYPDDLVFESHDNGVTGFIADYLTPKSVRRTGDLVEVITGGPWDFTAYASSDLALGPIGYTITGTITDLPHDALPSLVPELGTWTLSILGIAGVGVQVRRRRQPGLTPTPTA
jgi:hypothetical protein